MDGSNHAWRLLGDVVEERRHVPGNHRATAGGYAMLSEVGSWFGQPDEAARALRQTVTSSRSRRSTAPRSATAKALLSGCEAEPRNVLPDLSNLRRGNADGRGAERGGEARWAGCTLRFAVR
jgi:hypothetical protein